MAEFKETIAYTNPVGGDILKKDRVKDNLYHAEIVKPIKTGDILLLARAASAEDAVNDCDKVES